LIAILDAISDKAEHDDQVPYDLLVQYYQVLKQYHAEQAEKSA
jgi:hypothetical protein